MVTCPVRVRFRENSAIGILTVLTLLSFSVFTYYHVNKTVDKLDGMVISVQNRESRVFTRTSAKKTENEKVTTSRRIFFHETSGRGILSFQQCCAVESAAKHNPTRPVQLYLSADHLNTSNPWLDVLRNYTNVQIILVDNQKYFKGSPFEEWYEKGEWRQSRFRIAHLSDYIRLVSLYNDGGLYMDLDCVVLRPLKEKILHNVLLVEEITASSLSNGVMHFEAKHWLVREIMKFMASEYDPEDYYLHGPTAVTKVFTERCHDEHEPGQETITDVSKEQTFQPKKKKKCPDVKLMSYKNVYPISSIFWQMYFEDVSAQSLPMLKGSFAAHVWSSLSHSAPIRIGSKQLYAIMAQQHCPLTTSKGAEFLLI